MKPSRFHAGCQLARNVSAALGFAIIFAATPATAAENGVAERVARCFEGPAAEAAAKGRNDDDFSRSLAEMSAGRLCEKMAAGIIRGCLAEIDDLKGDGAKDYYPCIGIVANPCIDSQWASNEFRSAVCAGTEEKVWLDIVHENLAKLRARLGDKPRQRLEAMEKGFFEFRNEKCGLARMLRENAQPDLAYGACTTESAARFAIDLRDMAEAAEAGEATVGRPKTDANSGEAAMPAEEKKGKGAASADAGAAELGSKSAPVRADNPAGQRAYLQRLRCPDGSAPSFERQGSMGYGGYGHIVDLYKVRCESTGRNHEIYMDMDFPGYVETQAVKGFTLTDD